jgi:hypothetical protein
MTNRARRPTSRICRKSDTEPGRSHATLACVADAVLIALATVCTQNHHAFDALTGLLVVLAGQCAAIPLLEGRGVAIPRVISEPAS